eukprot:c26078_g1_i1 orf=1-177(-)
MELCSKITIIRECPRHFYIWMQIMEGQACYFVIFAIFHHKNPNTTKKGRGLTLFLAWNK